MLGSKQRVEIGDAVDAEDDGTRHRCRIACSGFSGRLGQSRDNGLRRPVERHEADPRLLWSARFTRTWQTATMVAVDFCLGHETDRGERPLGSPTIRDRMVQTATRHQANGHAEGCGCKIFGDSGAY
jgi:hypothetical protein